MMWTIEKDGDVCAHDVVQTDNTIFQGSGLGFNINNY